MNRAENLVDAMLEGYYNAPAPVAPPKPTIAPTRPATPGKPRPGTRPWNPSVRPGVNPRPKAREEGHGFVESREMPAVRKAKSDMKKFNVTLGKINQRIQALPPITGMRRHTAKKGKVPFSETEGGSMPVPPAPHDEGGAPEGPEPQALPQLSDYIRPGDRVTIQVPAGMGRNGQEWKAATGRAVMRSSQGGWVLNMGGPHGRPGVASDENIVSIRRGGKVIYGK